MTREITLTQLAMKIRNEVKLMVATHRNMQLGPAFHVEQLLTELQKRSGLHGVCCRQACDISREAFDCGGPSPDGSQRIQIASFYPSRRR